MICAASKTHRVNWRAHPMEMTVALGDSIALSWAPVSLEITLGEQPRQHSTQN